ncbi:MAG: lamin tail domain-containing protein [Prevotella sp.]|nr:lamin tail domain-containing protein [Prevotella sp.]
MKITLSFLFAFVSPLALSTAYGARDNDDNTATSLIINEVMASNAGVVMSPATNFDSWIELYNPDTKDVSLAGMYLSDDASNLTRWKMPSDVGTVPAKGFLVVWLGSDDIKSNQAPFKLDCDGGTICLSNQNGQLITSVTYPPAMSRTAWARTSDGKEEWNWTADATPGATNATAVFAGTRLDAPVVSAGSQLISGSLAFHVDIPEGAILMYSTDGSMPTSVVEDNTGGGNASPWINWVVNGDCEGDDTSCLVCKNGDGTNVTHIIAGVGYQGSRGIRIQSKNNPENVWDTQLFVYTPKHNWCEGNKYRFRMKVRADRADKITPQSQRTPGSYIHWEMLGGSINVTTEWKEYSYEGTITAEQSGNGVMQTIAFHLNESAQANVFYFDDIVWESYKGEGSSTEGPKQSQDGLFTVSQTANYVFRLFKDGYLPSVPVTRSFIKTDNNYTIPVISVVGDERYFTDPMWGIDVKGENGIAGNGSDDPVNWNQPWDRPVNFSYISPTEGMLFNQDVNISVSGGWTRMADPRSMKLKSNKVFDGLNRFNYVFFPQKPYIRSKTLLVRNGGNDVYSGSRFMDPALTTIVQRSGIDIDVQSFVQVAEYINGRFRGILNLREPSNDKFVYANFGYDDEEIDMFENSTFTNGTNEAFQRLLQLSERINDAGVYDEVKTLLDIDEFTNYMAAELYIGNDDWPNNNVKGYRYQTDGRYRFVLYDLDYALNAWDHRLSTLNDFSSVKIVRLFKNLLKHDAYRKKFIDTFCIMGGSVFEKNRATAIVNELADAMRPMSQYDNMLPDNSANKIKEALLTRMDDMTSQLQQYEPMKLSGVQKQSVQFAADVDNANIYINGIKVPYASFDGKLFSPVRLEAKAPAGYTFAGWRKSSGSFIQVFGMNSTWKYYDSGEAAANWQSASFNDTSWKSGAAPLGYKMNGVNTTVSYGPDAQNKYPTTYFRKTFTLDSAPASTDHFQLNYQVDDGCVVWVNGQEAGRVNMPQGTVNYNTFSSTYAADVPLSGTLDLNPMLFKKGANVIAVEVHNTSYTSGDLFWAGELQTTVGGSADDVVLTDAVIDVTDNAVNLTAMFTPLSDAERAARGLNPVRINEVSAANDIYVNEYFKRNDWVELYNTTGEPVDVEGMYLSDNLGKPKKYMITKSDTQTNTVIPAHGYLIIWCDKLETQSQLHASFKLDADGGDVLLTAADESWNDRITYMKMKSDETVGRYPDGGNQVYAMNLPTIEKSNIMSSYAAYLSGGDPSGISEIAIDKTRNISMSYDNNRLVIRSKHALTAASLGIYNITGQLLSRQTISLNNGYGEQTLDALSSGCYIARLSDGNGNTAICKFIKK